MYNKLLLVYFLSHVPLGVLARAAAIALTALLAEVTVPEIRLGGKMKLYLEIQYKLPVIIPTSPVPDLPVSGSSMV